MGMFSILADNILQLFRKYKAVNKGKYGHSIVNYCSLIYEKKKSQYNIALITNQNASPPDEGKTFGFAIAFSLEEISQNKPEL